MRAVPNRQLRISSAAHTLCFDGQHCGGSTLRTASLKLPWLFRLCSYQLLTVQVRPAWDEITRFTLGKDLLALWHELRHAIVLVTLGVRFGLSLRSDCGREARPGCVFANDRHSRSLSRGGCFRISAEYAPSCQRVGPGAAPRWHRLRHQGNWSASAVKFRADPSLIKVIEVSSR
jgi:hypothetical protein